MENRMSMLRAVKSVIRRGIKADISEQFDIGKTFFWWSQQKQSDNLQQLEMAAILAVGNENVSSSSAYRSR
ncbi:unnamed protein product, partial [Didymodactylos carnosus]